MRRSLVVSIAVLIPALWLGVAIKSENALTATMLMISLSTVSQVAIYQNRF